MIAAPNDAMVVLMNWAIAGDSVFPGLGHGHYVRSPQDGRFILNGD